MAVGCSRKTTLGVGVPPGKKGIVAMAAGCGGAVFIVCVLQALRARVEVMQRQTIEPMRMIVRDFLFIFSFRGLEGNPTFLTRWRALWKTTPPPRAQLEERRAI